MVTIPTGIRIIKGTTVLNIARFGLGTILCKVNIHSIRLNPYPDKLRLKPLLREEGREGGEGKGGKGNNIYTLVFSGSDSLTALKNF